MFFFGTAMVDVFMEMIPNTAFLLSKRDADIAALEISNEKARIYCVTTPSCYKSFQSHLNYCYFCPKAIVLSRAIPAVL